ncbi:hypothetical protein, partial [Kocuria subflava]|uniref:hypothetical protein n=1 Tax=Kocuria subflava TaxID=1736139 RepID=UPI001ADF9EF5
VPAAIGRVATVLGLIAAYAFSTKRRARHKSMFDAAVAAENTLAVLGPRAGTAAIQVAELAHTVARHERILYENAVADLSDGRLRLQDGKVTMVNHGRADGSYQSWQHPEWRAWRTKANKDEWMKLCEQRETTLATLTSLREALSQVESLSPFVRQAGTHSWALLLDSSPQSPRTSPWLAVTLY